MNLHLYYFQVQNPTHGLDLGSSSDKAQVFRIHWNLSHKLDFPDLLIDSLIKNWFLIETAGRKILSTTLIPTRVYWVDYTFLNCTYVLHWWILVSTVPALCWGVSTSLLSWYYCSLYIFRCKHLVLRKKFLVIF